MRSLLVVVGARPNFVKVARFRAVAERMGQWRVVLVHTGQHRDERMSDVFLQQFGLEPDHWLGTPAATPTARLAHIMLELESVVMAEKPSRIMAVGDVDSSLAAALTADRMGVPLVHLESGLRSGDRTMPEEINRILTDRIADQWFVTEQSAVDNLLREGADQQCVHFVGNTMIDTLVACRDRIDADPVLQRMGLDGGGHVLMTMHRPATVDDPVRLALVVDLIAGIAEQRRVVFPLHPRTADRLRRNGLRARLDALPGLVTTGPLDYLAFQKLLATASVVITDSGGVQEETTWRGVPCLTLRNSTERPVTVTEGTNELVPFEPVALAEALQRIREGSHRQGRIPHLWDGSATERVFEVLGRLP
jgi:UDP-N-acetylglucosamine 2-epimerase (non-hydrolysing)